MANKVTVTVTPVYHNVYEVKEVFTDVNRELSTGEYDEFDPNKQFAGLSKRGKLLSIPKTKGPATIDNYPLMLDSTDKTVLRSNQSVLVTTSKPNIGVFIEPCRYASVHTCIDNTNLLPRYTTDRNKVLTATYASVAVESVALALKYHAIYTSFLLLHNYGYTLLIPITVQLTTKEWHELGRYIFTGQPTGSF